MTGSIDQNGTCQLSWNIQEGKLLSPDGLQHCLPCERCGQPQWVSLQTVSIVCQGCWFEDPRSIPPPTKQRLSKAGEKVEGA